MSSERAKRLEQRAKKTRAAAHKRIIKNATIQFRLDAINMEKLLQLADERQTGVGVLARMWMLEKLSTETAPKSELNAVSSQLVDLQKQVLQLTTQVRMFLEKQKK